MTPTRMDMLRGYFEASPFTRRLGIRLVELGDDRVELELPFDPEHATVGDTVHGGAIATLLDTATMAAAWADDRPPEGSAGGATLTLSVDFVRAAHGVDLRARAEVVRRGRSACFVRAEALDPAGEVVATAQGVHRFTG